LKSPERVEWSRLDDRQLSGLLEWLGQNSDLGIPGDVALEDQMASLEQGMRQRREDSLERVRQIANHAVVGHFAKLQNSMGHLYPELSGIVTAASILPAYVRDSVTQFQHLFSPQLDEIIHASAIDTSLLSQTTSLDFFLHTLPSLEELKDESLRDVGLDVDILRWEGLDDHIEQFEEVLLDHAPASGSTELAWMLARWPKMPEMVLDLANQLPEPFRDHRVSGLSESIHSFQMNHFQVATISLSAQLDGLMGDLVVLSRDPDNASGDRLNGISARLSHVRNEFRSGYIQSSVLVQKGPFFKARNDIAHGDPRAPLTEEMVVRLMLHILSVLAVTVKRHSPGYPA
jgi:hypothetical protein